MTIAKPSPVRRLRTSLANLGAIMRIIVSPRHRSTQPEVDARSLVIEPTLDLVATRQADDSIVLRWTFPIDRVAIYASADPLQQGTLLQSVTGESNARLTGLDRTIRHYFTLVGDRDGQAFRRVVAERTLPVGQVNVRDIGGYPTQHGQHTRWGRIFRSGPLANFSDEDRAYWQQLGLTWVCDLRSHRELHDAPDEMPNPATTYLHWPMFSEERSSDSVRDYLLNLDKLDLVLLDSYRHSMIDQRADLFGQIFRRWLQPDQLPMVFHCTAGKDRTGVTAMLLLGVLGVADELIVADYTLSNYAHESLKQSLMQNSGALKMLRLSASDLIPLLLAHPDTMRRTIEHVHQRYGGYSAYLTKQAGLTEAELDQLRTLLLE